MLEDCHIFYILATSLRELWKYSCGKFPYLCLRQFQFSFWYIQLTRSPPLLHKDKVQRVVGRLDPINNTWTIEASMPTARHGLGVASIDDQIYIIGGGPNPGLTMSWEN